MCNILRQLCSFCVDPHETSDGEERRSTQIVSLLGCPLPVEVESQPNQGSASDQACKHNAYDDGGVEARRLTAGVITSKKLGMGGHCVDGLVLSARITKERGDGKNKRMAGTK